MPLQVQRTNVLLRAALRALLRTSTMIRARIIGVWILVFRLALHRLLCAICSGASNGTAVSNHNTSIAYVFVKLIVTFMPVLLFLGYNVNNRYCASEVRLFWSNFQRTAGEEEGDALPPI